MICAIRVDGCLISNKEIADFILCVYIQEDNIKLEKIFLIELKGSDIHKAIDQIEAMIAFFNLNSIELQARIILNKNRSKIPSGYDTKEKKFIKRIKGINKKSNYDRYRSESKIESL